RHKLAFLLGGQPEVPNRLIHVLWNLRGGPAPDFLTSGVMRTTGKSVARVVEVDDLLQALKVAIVHIGLDEIGARAVFDISQRSHLKLAVELRSQPRPIPIRVELRICEKGAYSFIQEHRA